MLVSCFSSLEGFKSFIEIGFCKICPSDVLVRTSEEVVVIVVLVALVLVGCGLKLDLMFVGCDKMLALLPAGCGLVSGALFLLADPDTIDEYGSVMESEELVMDKYVGGIDGCE